MKPKDLFSEHAADYSSYRPDYPSELFEFIYNHVSGFNSAWDCGTGNGQAAKVLARKFNKVYATDISDKQLSNAGSMSNIFYSVSPGEQTTFANNQFDLITVAQAIHWFRVDEFYGEVQRVGNHNSIIAIWGYSLLSINPDFDYALERFYKQVVGPYWDAERRHIDEHYKNIPFPFQKINSPEFQFCKQWTLGQLEGYLSTWSAVQKFIKAQSYNPVKEFIESTKNLLPTGIIEIRFPIFVKLGRVSNQRA